MTRRKYLLQRVMREIGKRNKKTSNRRQKAAEIISGEKR